MKSDRQDTSVPHVSRVEDRERLLADAVAHAEWQDERHRIRFPDPRGRRWKTPTALVLLAVAALVAAVPPAWMPLPRPPAVPTPAERDWGLTVEVYLQARQIEVFRAREGRLPHSLAEVPVRVPGLRFVRSNTRVYQLVARRSDGSALVYDSTHPAPEVEGAVRVWLAGETP